MYILGANMIPPLIHVNIFARLLQINIPAAVVRQAY
jgi:hypothetical protein